MEQDQENSRAEQNLTSTPHSTPDKLRAERLGWIVDQLTVAAIAKGQIFTAERLRINAEDLIDIPQETLAQAFTKARRELDYIPGVAELRRLALADDSTKMDAEMRRAWEVTVQFADRWCRWNDGRDRAYVEQDAPTLADRIVDVVRRSGGWSAYLGLSPDNFPFQQKRFFEEYQAWTAVETITDIGRLLVMPERKVLPAGAMTATPLTEPKPQILIKPVPPAPTPDELRERAASQKALLEEWKKKRGLA